VPDIQGFQIPGSPGMLIRSKTFDKMLVANVRKVARFSLLFLITNTLATLNSATMNLIEGQVLPDWEIKTLNNRIAPDLRSFQGAPLLILFFNLGCIACRGRAIPYSKRFSELYPFLQVVCIHSNFKGIHYLPGQIASFIKKKGVQYPVFLDQGKKTYDKFHAEGTPHWLLISSQGVLLKSIFGSMGNAIHRLDYGLTELFQKEAI